MQDILMVSYSNDVKHVVIVGRKKAIGNSIDIVNAFEGEEAKELYQKLIMKKVNKQ